ncbi:MAG TPA: DUF2914 domain-containing protein [Desulfotignum sp.]|nr:DUF2914 domain-containing protein [Desulfotignum sp.]
MKLFSFMRICLLLFLPAAVFFGPHARAQDVLPQGQSGLKQPVLVEAAMCEAIERFKPVNQAVVFSISLGRVFCFTGFDPVPEETTIYHRWYKQDRLISSARLVLNPPKWSSFSTMQLREADKGPWRVEIVDSRNNLMKTLRFSIVD